MAILDSGFRRNDDRSKTHRFKSAELPGVLVEVAQMLMDHNEYARERALRDPEFATAIRERAIKLLGGNEEDRRIAFRILQKQLARVS